MAFAFTQKTFSYLDAAKSHACDRAWFKSHKAQYEENVLLPFTDLVLQLKAALADHLPGIEFSPRKIASAVRRQTPDSTEPVVREKSTAFFSEPATSMFEMNPGIYLSFGASREDNVYGVELYAPSSRQLKHLRRKLISDVHSFEACLNPEVRECWGHLAGDRFTRFPKDFDPSAPGADYLWHKQLFLGKTISKANIRKPSSPAQVVDDLTLTVPFLQWIRSVVGVYRKPRDT